jgi:hypothetical protein
MVIGLLSFRLIFLSNIGQISLVRSSVVTFLVAVVLVDDKDIYNWCHLLNYIRILTIHHSCS